MTPAGPGIASVTASCWWSTSSHEFRCSFKTPAHVKPGKSHRYTITAAENIGPGFVTAPKTGKAVNPETIHFR